MSDLLNMDIIDYAKDAFRMGKGIGLRLVSDYSRIPVEVLDTFIEEGAALSREKRTLTDGEMLLVLFSECTKNEARLIAKANAVIDHALDPTHPEGVKLARWVLEEYAKRGLALAEMEMKAKGKDGQE